MRIPALVCACVLWNAGARASAQSLCESKDWQELARALNEKSPDLTVLDAKREFRAAEESAASLKPNSLVNGQYTSGGMPWRSSQFEASYLWTIEGESKVRSRGALAKAEADIVALEKEDLKAKQLLQLALLQQKLRKLSMLREILLETEETYSNIIRLYERIPARGPEQDTSLAVFQIARGENELKVKALDMDEAEVYSELSLLSGCARLRLGTKSLRPLNFGEASRRNESLRSTSFAVIESQKKALELGVKAERESLTSDLSIGPMIVAERDEDDNRLEVGLALSYPLGGHRQDVLAAVRTSEAKARRAALDLEQSRYEMQSRFWKEQYESARQALQKGLNPEEIAKKHRQLEKLFRSERVSAALVIEAHRQMLDHVNGYTELEYKAAQSLWNLRYLDGSLSWSDL